MRKLLPTTLEPAPPFFFSIPRLLYFLPECRAFFTNNTRSHEITSLVGQQLVKNLNLKYT
jgi:hypothetical protein